MLTLNDLHSQIDELLNVNSIESTFSKELYTDLINEQRALFIRNEYNKNREVDPYIQQTLACLEVEIVDTNICCTVIPGCDKMLRSKLKIPNTIEFYQSKGITAVGPINLMKSRFSLVDYKSVSYLGQGRTNQKAIYAFLYNEYIWIYCKDFISISLLEKITLDGIFEDPTSLQGFVNCSGSGNCWSLDSAYPINQWMWAYMKSQIIQQLVPKLSLPLDEANDTKDGKINEGQRK